MADEELKSIINLLDLKKAQPVGHLAIKHFFGFVLDDDIEGVREAVKNTAVRDYLYDRMRTLHKAHVILHFNENTDGALAADGGSPEKEYILNKIDGFEEGLQVKVLYVGGGHGGYIGVAGTKVLSGLEERSMDEIAQRLSSKGLKIHSAILHACYSALFTAFFRPFLLDEYSPLLSYSSEMGASSHWEMMMSWIKNHQDSPFFSDMALAKPWESGELTATTCVLSTQYSNQFMDFTQSADLFPDFCDQDDEAALQRELLIGSLEGEAGSNILMTRETDVNTFNEVSVMSDFNEWLQGSLTAEPSDNKELEGGGFSP